MVLKNSLRGKNWILYLGAGMIFVLVMAIIYSAQNDGVSRNSPWFSDGAVIISFGAAREPYLDTLKNTYQVYDKSGKVVDRKSGEGVYYPAVVALNDVVALSYYGKTEFVNLDEEKVEPINSDLMGDSLISPNGDYGALYYNVGGGSGFTYKLRFFSTADKVVDHIIDGAPEYSVAAPGGMVFLSRQTIGREPSTYALHFVDPDGELFDIDFPPGFNPDSTDGAAGVLGYSPENGYFLIDYFSKRESGSTTDYSVRLHSFDIGHSGDGYQLRPKGSRALEVSIPNDIKTAIWVNSSTAGWVLKDGTVRVLSYDDGLMRTTGHIDSKFLRGSYGVSVANGIRSNFLYTDDGGHLQIRDWMSPDTVVADIPNIENPCIRSVKDIILSDGCEMASVYIRL